MRLGGPILATFESPEQWIRALTIKGYRSAYAPIGVDATSSQRNEYRQAAAEEDIVIAEVGAWSNPLSPDQSTAREARRRIVDAIRLGDDLGARTVVNIAGSRGEKWDGPSPLDYTDETFDAIVSFVQSVLDETAPERTCYSLEPMPWMYPDSAHSYRRLIKAVDRSAFRVHYDPVNMLNSPAKVMRSGAEVVSFIDQLGPMIVSVHAKDVSLNQNLTVHIDEQIPGDGIFDFEQLLRSLDTLDHDLPILVEHLKSDAEYDQAVRHIRSVATSLEIAL